MVLTFGTLKQHFMFKLCHCVFLPVQSVFLRISFSTVFVLFCLQALRLLVPKSSIMEIKLKIAVLTHSEEYIVFFFSS